MNECDFAILAIKGMLAGAAISVICGFVAVLIWLGKESK